MSHVEPPFMQYLNALYEQEKTLARLNGKAHSLTIPIMERRYGLQPKTLSNYRSNNHPRHRLWRQRQLKTA